MVREAYVDWRQDEASRHAAALSYYTTLSVGPLLIVAVALAGVVFGEEAARSGILSEMENVLGPEGAASAEALLRGADRPRSGGMAALFGLGIVLFGASRIFAELERSLDHIWEVEPPVHKGLWRNISRRFVSVGMVFAVALLLLLSLATTTLLSALAGKASAVLPGGSFIWSLLHVGVTLVGMTLLFAMVFKTVPSVAVAWRDVWLGAIATAVLFVLGQTLLGIYIGRVGISSGYGAAGSVVALLVWTYYSAQIFLFGAELTQVFASRHGSRIGRQPPADEPADADERDGERVTTPGESPETRRSRTGLRWGASPT